MRTALLCLAALMLAAPCSARDLVLATYSPEAAGVSGKLVLGKAAGEDLVLSLQITSEKGAKCEFEGKCERIQQNAVRCRDDNADEHQYLKFKQLSDTRVLLESTYPADMLCSAGLGLDGHYQR